MRRWSESTFPVEPLKRFQPQLQRRRRWPETTLLAPAATQASARHSLCTFSRPRCSRECTVFRGPREVCVSSDTPPETPGRACIPARYTDYCELNSLRHTTSQEKKLQAALQEVNILWKKHHETHSSSRSEHRERRERKDCRRCISAE
uniref:Uncharacterized protein n=1 Tax=Tetraselmis sp. GSL018 TaxID=582737 RepID=A0A061RND6_9CHLO